MLKKISWNIFLNLLRLKDFYEYGDMNIKSYKI